VRHLISIAVILLAAGRGSRFGDQKPKQYTNIGSEPVIRKTAKVFLSHKQISSIIVVIHPKDRFLCEKALSNISTHISLIEGGKTRQESAYAGLRYLKRNPPDYVHIHDSVRPFITHAQLNAIHKSLTPCNGVLLALPVSETLKKVDQNQHVRFTIPRSSLFYAQTPQSFPYPLILKAHKAAYRKGKNDFTDDSSLAEWHDIPMKIIESSPKNIKITWRKDLEMANQYNREKTLFPDIRTGNGYDVHKLVPGDGIILCGIKIPYQKKLLGHSDADVALHALTDALLATLGADDIGTHFSSSNLEWKQIKSEKFVQYSLELIHQKKGHIINVDITLIAESPQISPYRTEMKKSLHNILGIARDRISIKAKTNEMLGFIGRNEGIAAIATANVFYKTQEDKPPISRI
jgi:2-C-methyl-D-erythritol 4-phosphate cytidylyltransferase/2-C-methyl-D-erythritol 2,4-cyclodiphosphate synthase